MSDILRKIISIVAAVLIVGVNIFLLYAFPLRYLFYIIVTLIVIAAIALIISIGALIYDWLS